MAEYKGKKVIFSPHVHLTGTADTQTKTVALSMASGNQVVTPDANKVLTQVTITKPATLLEGNIRKNINIGGVVGTLEEGITPTGTKNITSNGTHDVTNYASAAVNVDTSEETYQSLLSATFGS